MRAVRSEGRRRHMLTVEEASDALMAGMGGHVHDLAPVVSDGELVASVCVTCWAQRSAEAWISQNDAIIAEYERQQRIDACGEHDRDEVEVMAWGQVEPVQTITTPCRKCGG